MSDCIADDVKIETITDCKKIRGLLTAFDPIFPHLKEKILSNHERVITFNKNKMLYSTYIDNKKQITCKTREGLEDKLVQYYIQNCTGLYHFPNVFERALAFNRENDFLASSPNLICFAIF